MGHQKEIRFRGRTYPVLGQMIIGRKSYLLVDRVSSGDREKYQAFDPHAGPGGDMRLVYVVPRGQTTSQHLQVLKRLSVGNRNLPQILEFHPGREFFQVVTTWVWGKNLWTYLEEAGCRPRSWPSAIEAFKLFRGLAHGLSQLHNHRNIVHGDIKPENLVLAREPNRLVIVDFGSAWTVERSVGRGPGDGRTDEFAAPEQFQEAGLVDFRSDMFSASVVAYLMLTGQLPYDKLGGRAGLPQYKAVFASKLVAPSQMSRDPEAHPKDLWARIDQVVLQGLALDPPERFASSNIWIRDLNEIDAHFKLRLPLGRINRAFLSLFHWVRGKFSAT